MTHFLLSHTSSIYFCFSFLQWNHFIFLCKFHSNAVFRRMRSGSIWTHYKSFCFSRDSDSVHFALRRTISFSGQFAVWHLSTIRQPRIFGKCSLCETPSSSSSSFSSPKTLNGVEEIYRVDFSFVYPADILWACALLLRLTSISDAMRTKLKILFWTNVYGSVCFFPRHFLFSFPDHGIDTVGILARKVCERTELFDANA